MRKLVLSIIVSFGLVFLYAQDTTLNEYVGTYIFPEGGPVTMVEVKLENGSLLASSTAGSSPLERASKDTFNIIAHDGKAYFTRDSTKKVNGIKIEVGETILEGKKNSLDFATINDFKHSLWKRKSRLVI
jgi:Domain of unknown function (DUF3471)